MNGRPIIIVAWLAAILFCIPVRAEILVLKNGTKVPCRILLQDDESVTIRDARGNEMSYPMKDVDRIDPAVSSVEMYEAVAEQITPDCGALPYYLAVWLLEQDPESTAEVEKLLAMASNDPAWRGRALYQRSRIASGDTEKRGYILQALAADPCIAEAAEAAADLGGTADGIPKGLLLELAEGIGDALSGSYPDAARKIREVSTYRDPGPLAAASLRLREITGLSIEDLDELCSRAAARAREAGFVEETPVVGDCDVCGGSGHVQCDRCEGDGLWECQTCKGAGTLSSGSRHAVMKYKPTRKCAACRGYGAKECPVCLRRPAGATVLTRSISIPLKCAFCDGKGLIETTTTRGMFRTTTATVSKKMCSKCSGAGSTPRHETVTLKSGASGTRRCQKCNRDGKIPPPWGETDQRSQAQTRGQIMSRQTPDELFGRAAMVRLSEFAGLARDAANGNPGYRWEAGSVVSVYQSEQTIDKGEEIVFVGGKWYSPDRAGGARRRIKMLMQEPRKVDLSGFADWIERHELSRLKDCAIELGAGKDAAQEITGIVALYRRGSELGRRSAFDVSRIYRTTFEVSFGTTDKNMLCTYAVRQDAGPALLELTALQEPDTWPGTSVRMQIAPDYVLDASDIAETLGSDPQLRGCALEFRYRIRGCSWLVRGEGDDTSLDYTLEIEPLVVVARKGTKTLNTWIAGTEQLLSRQ
jgi:hypothetical protein